MTPTRARALVVLFAVLSAGSSLLVACGSSSSSTPATAPPAPVDMRGHASVDVVARDNRFSPATIIVDAGTTVTWRNDDSVAHDVVKSADALDFGAPFGAQLQQFGPGRTYRFTFRRAGTYGYTCTVHTGMTGVVRVVTAARPSPTS